MDETRLKEIESQLVAPTALERDLHNILVALPELIAALRDAWRERDFAEDQVLGVVEQRNRDSSEMQHQRERADRAEAKVALLDKQVELMRKNFEVVERVLHQEIDRLEPIREAAEALLNASYGWDRDFADRALIGLRRTLDAYKRKGGGQHG